MRQPQLIAIVDDDRSMREATNDLLHSAGYSAMAFASAQSLMKSKCLQDVACIVSDMRMPGMTGLDLHRWLAAEGHRIPTILMTAYPSEQLCALAAAAGIRRCLPKPFTAEVLLGSVDAVLRDEDCPPASSMPREASAMNVTGTKRVEAEETARVFRNFLLAHPA
jgi:FixJ family two-component response regulator